MAPPAKRQRKNVVHESEDEDEDSRPPHDNLLTRFLNSSPSKQNATRLGNGTPSLSPSPLKKSSTGLLKNAPSPSPSPEKSRARAAKKPKSDDKFKSGDLVTLFSRQASKAQSSASSTTRPRVTPVDDILSDPISEDDEVADSKACASSFVGQNARKRLRDDAHAPPPFSSVSSTKPSSHIFLKPPKPSAAHNAIDEDLRPWSERFGPVSFDELAVHKKKVADVRAWIENVMGGRMRQRLLLLKGAAGTGKTTTVRLLARDLGYELLEWRNPTGNFVPGVQSSSAQFDAFLGVGGRFGGLDTVDDTEMGSTNNSSLANSTQPINPPKSRRIILVEEFPNTFTRSSSTLTSFRSTLTSFLASNTPSLATLSHGPSRTPITPVIMIVSETLLTTTSASADSFTAHRLLGPDILRHPGVGVIEFNAIAPTILTKALELVVLKEARKSGRKKTPGPQVLRRLAEIGDIRNAVSSLEFLCLKGDEDADWGAKVYFTKSKRGSKNPIALTDGEAETLEQVSQREASLGIFHAVGKVIYNKRDDTSLRSNPAEDLPKYMAHLSRPKRSQVSVDTLIDETGTDTSTFISAVHENYLLSCEAPDPDGPQSTMDHVNGCIEHLSDSDLLCPSWDNFFGGRGLPGGRDSGSHVLRQDEMAFQVATRGILFSLPYPVRRRATGPGRGPDAFKMFYPTSIKLWRAREEMESQVDQWSTKLLRGEESRPEKDVTAGAGLFKRPATSSSTNSSPRKGVLSSASFAKKPCDVPNPHPSETDIPPLLSLGNAARLEMILERLPYMALIARARKSSSSFPSSSSLLRLRNLDKVVSFHGIGTPSDEVPDEKDDAAAVMGVASEAWATDRPTEDKSPRKKTGGIRAKVDGPSSGVVMQVHKLVLSDDDIED